MSKQSITIEVDLIGKATSLSETIGKLQSDLSKLDLGKGLQESFKTNFAVINSEIEKIQNIAAKKKINVIDDKQIQKSLSAIETAYASVLHKLESEGVNTSFLKQDKKAIDALTTANKNYTNSVKETRSEYNKLAKELEKIQNSQKDSRGKIESKRVLSDSDYKKLEDEVQRLKAEKKAATSARGTAAGQLTRKYGKGWQQDTSKISTEELEKYNEKAEKAEALTEQLKAKQDQLNNSISNSAKTKAIGDLDSALQKIKDSMAKVDDAASFEKIKQELLAIKDVDWGSLGIDINSIKNIDQLNTALTKLGTDAGERAKQVIANIGGNSQVASGQLNNARTAVDGYTKSLQEMTDRERDIEGIKSRITYFFGLANAINLARRAMRQAFNTVKELDAAMTETAVVTDFSVGDMWDQLPRYTEAANKLGATTLGAYQTMTLFYQQGLDTNEAFALGTETMKMARIAGLDYADATDKMTAALRGFNMELNEASAQRVNDVYSELAAITAADTEEIANAMTKTASIAHSANMEFETTAAFLSQIIETTRESAETAGTAMKTVIARFQELKKDPSEIGEVDGEIVDANKIETALRSVGVALRDSTGQFRDLDDVFLELASKWDGLDTNTQRYIATIAAGSRQQSRFIAMMSNYERTMELVNAANNSAGASQSQFNKTLESLEAKLNKLKNAWNEFTMGITNNQAIKAGVDILTGLLNVINKVTGITGNEGIGGLITAISKLALAWAGLKGGKAIFNGITSSFGKEGGEKLGKSLADSFKVEFKKNEKGIITQITSTFKKIKTPTLPSINKAPQESIERLTQAYNKLNTATLTYDSTFQATSSALIKKNQVAATAVQFHQSSIGKLNQTLGLNTMQQNLVNSAISSGVPISAAYSAVLNGLTAEEWNQISANILLQETDEEVAKEKLKVALATYAQQKAGQMLLQSKGRLLSIVLFGTAAQKAEALALLETAGAEEIATFWTWALKLSMGELVLIILGVVAAVALLVVGIAALVKHAKATSIEGQFKNAQEEAERAAEKVKELTEAYDSLTSAIEAVEEKRDALDEMIYGTQEWRDAVKEVNSEMLKIAELDPDLAPFITNNNGVLEFDYNKTNYKGQTYEDVMSEKESNLNKAQQIEIGTRIEVSEEKINKIVDEYSQYGLQGIFGPNGITFGNGQEAVTWTTEEKRENENQIARDTASGKIVTTGDYDADVKAYSEYLANEFGITGQAAIEMSHQLALNRDGLLEFGNALFATEGEIEGYTNALVAGAVSDSGLKGEQAATGEVFLQSRIDQLIEKNKIDPTKLTTEDRQNYADIFGYELIDGQLYSRDDQGKLVKEKDITDEDIATQLAYSYAVEEGTSAMIGFVNNIDKVGGAFGTLMKETYAAADGMGITQDSLKEFFGEDKRWENGLDDTERRELMGDVDEEGNYIGEGTTTLSKAWEALPSEIKASFASYEEFANYQLDAWNNAALAYADATKLIDSTFTEGSGIGAALDGIIEYFHLTAGEAKALSSALYDVAMNGGDAATFLNQVNTMLTGLSGEDRDRALALINSTDWTDKDEVNNTLNALEDLGVVIGDDFKQQILEATRATREFSMDRINDELKKTAEVLDIISEKAENGEVTYTQEEYEALVAAGVDSKDFVYTDYDEWTYLGETNDLLAAIEGTTEAILQEMGGGLQEDITKGEAAVAWGEQKADQVGYETNAEVIEGLRNDDFYINDYNNQNAFAAKAFLSTDEINKIATEFGIDTTDLSTDVIVERIISYWDTYAGGLEGNYAKQEEYNRQYGVMQWSQKSGQEMLLDTPVDEQDAEYRDLALDAAGVQGGTYQVEAATKALTEQNEALTENERRNRKTLAQRQQISRVSKALAKDINDQNKAQDNLNKTIEENADAFENAEKGTQQYNKALHNITQAAQNVFGEAMDEKFVEDNKESFLKLAEGGEAALEGYAEICKAWGDKTAQTLINSNEKVKAAGNDLQDVHNVISNLPDIEFGATFDATQAMNELMALGFTAAEAANILESFGYTVTYSYETHLFGKASNQDYGPDFPGAGIASREGGLYGQKVLIAAGVKNTPSGSGFSGGGGGGGGGGGKEDVWENPYDEFYNITEQINEELRTREQIEHDYNKLLKDRRTSIDEIRQSQLDQIASLRRELDLQQQLLEGRKRQYSEIGQETYADEEGNYKSFSEWGVTKYASYDDKTGLITIDWEGIDQITDTELGGAVEAYISQIEEWSGLIEDIEDEIRDIEDQIEEIKNAEKDAYLEFEERIYEALVEADQKVIDTYQELSDTISDSNEKILNSLSESIELERQIRDNTKTEEEIADKEARLAYLRRDTSGANDLEIKQLEEELADARESYGDTLIDQELDRLNKVNEEANAQREQQIALMQAQLDWNEQNGIYWAHVDSLLDGAINSDGTFNYNSELAKLLEESDAFKGMSQFGQMNWINELVEEFLTANRGFENWMVDRAKEKEIANLADGKFASYDSKNDRWVDEEGNEYRDIIYNAEKDIYELGEKITKKQSDQETLANYQTTEEIEIVETTTTTTTTSSSGSSKGQSQDIPIAVQEALGLNTNGLTAEQREELAKQTGKNTSTAKKQTVITAVTEIVNKKRQGQGKTYAYKNGGLADFTGPAWLDGTKSNPEMVLNATDTQNFIQLKDILSSLLNRGSSNTQTSGDNYYNFDITVEEIGSDYDVDQMIDRVRERIYDDASYRNVNAINFLR